MSLVYEVCRANRASITYGPCVLAKNIKGAFYLFLIDDIKVLYYFVAVQALLLPTIEAQVQNDERGCAHCGAASATLTVFNRKFCCDGCARVYEILRSQNLLEYYDFAEAKPSSLKNAAPSDFCYTDGDWFKKTFTATLSGNRYSMQLKLPAIHCAACVWLLEKLPEMLSGVLGARINYLRKELTVVADSSLAVSRLVQFIADLGYTPDFKPESAQSRALSQYDKGLLKRMAVAAFGFGNAMLFSFPEYFSERLEERFQLTFMLLNVSLAVFILYYSAGEFFTNAWHALRRKKIIIDLPIAIGIAAMFARSLNEIRHGVSSGYFDTFAGLIFFLLIGRYVQSRSYTWLAFERDNLLFLPLAVRVKKGELENVTAVQDLRVGDTIRLLNGEISPTRCRVLSSHGSADYAFTTGEAYPVALAEGDIFEIGGRVIGHSLELEVIEPVDQGRINRIWESASAVKEDASFSAESSFADRMLPYFTVAVVGTAISGFLYWFSFDSSKAWNVFSAVLVITCPCALAMSKPFSFFTTQNVLGRAGLYLKCAAVVEKFFAIRQIIFDKTGTITAAGAFNVEFQGEALNPDAAIAFGALARESSHPLSRAISGSESAEISDFHEYPGHGISGCIDGFVYLLGSQRFLQAQGVEVSTSLQAATASAVHAVVGAHYLGAFMVQNKSRESLSEIMAELSHNYKLGLISGDGESERERFVKIFPKDSPMHFNASPTAKAKLIDELQKSSPVMMLGDGLNDAEALGVAHLAIALSEDRANFSPSSDAILDAKSFHKLPVLLAQARQAKTTAIIAYVISFGYNIFGVSVALTGSLTPLFCAILMPLSSLSVIGFTFFTARFTSRLRGLT